MTNVGNSCPRLLGIIYPLLTIERSELLRAARHHYLVRLNSERDAKTWEDVPPTDSEQALAGVADWGPAEYWSDWADAAR